MAFWNRLKAKEKQAGSAVSGPSNGVQPLASGQKRKVAPVEVKLLA